MSKVYGIDLGTTYSCMAEIDQSGRAQMVRLPRIDDAVLFPSVVSFSKKSDGTIVPNAGQEAKEQLETNEHENVCVFIKREMGSREYKFHSFEIDHSPEEISSLILKGLIEASQRADVMDVVITCPAYFGESERLATLNAAKIAGLNVLALLNEPTAAAIAYGVDLQEEKNILVYDLGGGTFDSTIIHVKDNEIKVIATDGDHHLGGADWDNRIREYIISQYAAFSGKSEQEITNDFIFMAKLVNESEKTKKKLSQKEEYSPSIGEVKNRVSISRDTFEYLTKDLLQRTIEMTKKVMDMARKKNVMKIDQILLVGGSTLMPQVEKLLRKEFPGIEISKGKNPHECVACGAALYAQNIQNYKIKDSEDPDSSPIPIPIPIPPIKLKNIVTKSYAIEHLDPEDPKRERTVVTNVIFRNQELPLEEPVPASIAFDDARAVSLKIFENNLVENEREKNRVNLDEDEPKTIIDCELGPLPSGLKAGSAINIVIKIDEMAHFTLDAIVVDANVSTHQEVELVDAISEKDFNDAKNRVQNVIINVD